MSVWDNYWKWVKQYRSQNGYLPSRSEEDHWWRNRGPIPPIKKDEDNANA